MIQIKTLYFCKYIRTVIVQKIGKAGTLRYEVSKASKLLIEAVSIQNISKLHA
jgi:hypothetical protein